MTSESNSCVQRYGEYTIVHISPTYENESQKEAERQRIARQVVEDYIALKAKE